MGISASHRRPTGLHLAESDAVAILDFPEHFGRAVASCRRFHRFNRTTPILVICTVQGSEQRATLFEAGADQVLDEPFCRRELAARVASLRPPFEGQPARLRRAARGTRRHLARWGNAAGSASRSRAHARSHRDRAATLTISGARYFTGERQGIGERGLPRENVPTPLVSPSGAHASAKAKALCSGVVHRRYSRPWLPAVRPYRVAPRFSAKDVVSV